MPARASCANPGEAMISALGAVWSLPPLSARYGSSVPKWTRQIQPCCSSCCSRTKRFRSRSIPMTPSRDQSAWRMARPRHGYILSATSNAEVAVGLKWKPTTQQLRTSIEDGSIVDMVCWHPVRAGDIVFVPAGTIHAIGPGLVIAEIQQRSDTTFRLFDFGRQRELHTDNAVTVAHAGPADAQTASRRLTDARTLLVACSHFVLERIDLVPYSIWKLDAANETWLLVLDGHVRVGPTSLSIGEAAFLEADRATIQVGDQPLQRPCRLSGHRTQERLVECANRPDGRLLSSPSGGAIVTRLSQVAFIGNSLPRRCGIATFTTHLQQAVTASRPDLDTRIVAMTDQGHDYDYPPVVCFQIEDHKIEDYARAAAFLNAGRFDAVSLQHEFGIFGGAAGGHVMALLSQLTMPIVTTAPYCSGHAKRHPAGRFRSDHRRIVKSRRHVEKRPGSAARRLSGPRRKDRTHSARNPGLPFRRA